MSGFNHQYKKYVFLPSGGYSYPPDAFLSNITLEASLLNYDVHAYYSQFEYMFSIIKRHVSIDINILDLYLIDFYYLWSVIHSIELEQNDEYKINTTCSKCEKVNKVIMEFSKMKFNIINKYENNFNPLIIKINNYTITFKLRKVKDNLNYSYFYLYFKNKTPITNVLLYIITQTEEIIDSNGNKVNEKDYYEFYNMITDVFGIYKIYEIIAEYNNRYGFENKIYYRCMHCHTKNNLLVFDDIRLCTFSINGGNENRKVDMYTNNINYLQLNLMNIDQLYNIPLKDMESYNKAMSQIKLMPKFGI